MNTPPNNFPAGDLADTLRLQGRALAEARNGIVITDPRLPDNPIVYYNRAFQELTGYSEQEILGRNCRFLQGPDTDPVTVAQIRRALQEERACHVTLLNYRRDGSAFWNDLTLSPVRDDSGELTHFIGVQADTSAHKAEEIERHQADRRLAESEQRYKSLFDYNMDAVFSFDLDGYFLSANDACETVSGFSPSELLGTSFVPLLVPEDREGVFLHFVQAKHGKPQAFETTITHKTKRKIVIAVTLVPTVVDEIIVGVFGIAEDITVRKRAEEAEREAAYRQKTLLREVLSSVTGGKLLLCESPTQLPALLAPMGDPIALTQTSGLRELRQRTLEAARMAGHAEERQYDLVTAVSEAGMNAIVHGGGLGTAWVSAGENGTVQTRVEDRGQGIAMEHLPKAALSRGFSTSATLGHGLKMILETIDRQFLLTSSSGTTVVLENERETPLPPWLAERLGE